MKKQTIRWMLGLMLLLLFHVDVTGQQYTIIRVSGDTAVCTGSAYRYHEYTSAYPGPSTISYYTWTVVRGGIALYVSPSDRDILWGAPGVGYVIVAGYDTTNQLVDRDTLQVSIKALPAPIISTDTRVACAPLDEPGSGEDPGYFEDSSCQKVCAYNTVAYTANGDPSSTYSWSVLGGYFNGSSTGQTCTIDWWEAGPGKLTVQEISQNGCVGEASICVDIIESPIAHFVALPDTSLRHLNVCKGSEVIFIDNSTSSPSSPIVAWRWDFGDGSFSNAKGSNSAPISHKYDNPGLYTVTLTVTNQCGCSTTETMDIDVDPDAGVEIICPGVVCEGGIYTYQVDANCTGGAWQVIGGTILTQYAANISVKWDQVDPEQGFGYIVYDPGGCAGYCPSAVAIKIPVVKTSADIKGPNFLCANKQYLYSLPQWPSTRYIWTVSDPDIKLQATDQPNEIVLTPSTATGPVTLTCRYTNTLLGCSGMAFMQIEIPGNAVITDTVFDYCEGVETYFHLAGPNLGTAQWTLLKPDNTTVTAASGSSFAVLLDLVGTYLLSVEGNFCPPEPVEVRVIGIPEVPESITGPGRICKGIPTEYLGGTIDAKHIFGWSINNGSLNTTAGEVTEVTLDVGASYPFTLNLFRETKAKPHCRSATISKEILAPWVSFSVTGPDSLCPSQYYDYKVNYEEGEAYDWTIIPHTMGSVDSGQGTTGVRVLWNKQGGHAKVACRIAKCYNSYSYDTLDVYVRPLELDLTVSEDTICLTHNFFAEVNVATSGVHWYLNDNGNFTDPGETWKGFTPAEPIKALTTYKIAARVDSPYGCATPIYAEDSIVVVPAPTGWITPWMLLEPCDGPLNHTLVSHWDTAGIQPSSYSWSANGAFLGSGSNYTVTDTGTYTLHVTGSFGCPSFLHVEVKPRTCYPIHPSGEAPPPGSRCEGKYATLDDSLLDCGEGIYLKLTISDWARFSHGHWVQSYDSLVRVSYTDTSAVYKPKRAGLYQVYYKAFFDGDSSGYCISLPRLTIAVPFVPDLEVKALCYEVEGYRQIKFIDHSTSLNGPVTWRTFQERNSSGSYVTRYSGPNKTFTTSILDSSSASSAKSFRMIVADGQDTCTVYWDTIIAPLPKAGFAVSRPVTCEKDAAVYFTNTSWPSAASNTNTWDFGDISKNDQDEPYRVYNEYGTYPVSLKTTDIWGCSDSITQNVEIKARLLNGHVAITPEFPCEHSVATAYYQNTGSHVPVYYEWFDKNAIRIGIGGGMWDLYRSGYYFAYVKDQYGCRHTAKGDTVLFIKAPPAFIYGGESQCQGVPFNLSGYAGQVAGLSYEWERDGVVIPGATGPDLLETISSPGTYIYNVSTIVPNPAGGYCTDRSDDFVVEVHAQPAAPVINFTVLDCNEYTLELDVSPSYPGTYNWSNGMWNLPVQVNHGGPFQVTYTDENGCVNKGKIQTPRDLRVYLWIFPTGCYSLCYSDPNILTGPIMPFQQWHYQQNGSPFIAGSGIFSPVSLNGTGPGFYEMYLENAWCNIMSDTMDVDFDCTPGGPGSVGIGTKYASGIDDLAPATALLELAPNPARHSTHISYRYTDKASPAYIEVYDLLGRVVFGRSLPDAEGGFDMDLEHFAPGTYRVLLRQGGRVLLHQQLSVTR